MLSSRLSPSLSLVSPLLDGPFLISPSRRQNTTLGDPHTHTRQTPIKDARQNAALAPRLPQGRLRGGVPAGLHPQQMPPSRCTRKSVSNISTHRVSTYDPLARRSTPSLDSRQAPDSLSILSGLYRDPPASPTPRELLAFSPACGLHCLSRISVWSDLRPHRHTAYCLLLPVLAHLQTTVFNSTVALVL